MDIEANKDKSAFGQLFSNMKDRSVKDMRAIVAEAQNMLNFVEKVSGLILKVNCFI